jgi:non-heme chloroperoxidase
MGFAAAEVEKGFKLSKIPPLMLQTPKNPKCTPIEAFDQLCDNVVADRSQFWKGLSMPF